MLEPLKDKLTIIQGLSGKMTRLGQRTLRSTLSGYKASRMLRPFTQPSMVTCQSHFPQSLIMSVLKWERAIKVSLFLYLCKRKRAAITLSAEPNGCL